MKTIDYRPGVFCLLSYLEIDQAHTWENRDGAPRDECFMSDSLSPYTYGKGRGERTYNPIPFSPLIRFVRDSMQPGYDLCFSNKYIDGTKHLGWHSDDGPTIDHKRGIAVVSFGAERDIWFRPIGTTGEDVITKIRLGHGSVLTMPPGFQQTHQHRIPKAGFKCGPRISLTFRKTR